jgi:hypothetical protein
MCYACAVSLLAFRMQEGDLPRVARCFRKELLYTSTYTLHLSPLQANDFIQSVASVASAARAEMMPTYLHHYSSDPSEAI